MKRSRIASGNKKAARNTDVDSPPPYDTPAAPLVVAETTTTTTTTTKTTTTHFFPFPLWRRHATPSALSPPSTPTRPSTSSGDARAFRSITGPAASFPYDKDLPPTPGSERATSFSAQHPADSQSRPSRKASRPSTGSIPGGSSMTTLAQASLGVGLSHVIPNASSTAQVNSIAFAPDSQAEQSTPRKSLHRTKSLSRMIPSRGKEESTEEYQRMRGISTGVSTQDLKGKAKQVDATLLPTKPLTRRGSFWNRKKSLNVSETPSGVDIMPSIPSPSNSTIPNSPSHARGLSRSNSERARTARPLSVEVPAQQHIDTSPPSSRPRRRPSTAEPGRASRSSSIMQPLTPLTATPITATPAEMEPQQFPSKTTFAEPQLSHLRRPRAQTNPPFLHRLSLNIFGSSSPPPSAVSSRDSTATRSSPRPSLNRSSISIPKPQVDEESPQFYLSRLSEAVSKAEIAGILASSSDSFHAEALQAYISKFNFSGHALDIALRRLLMDVGLPRETQQIDRVMEAFAVHYRQCNPGLFVSDDHPYILAFSLIMLHTDAFNKSNKKKMTKADYVKNTKLPGIAVEVLDCFYDNIVFAPFIFIEDPLDVNGQRGLSVDGSQHRTLPSNGFASQNQSSTNLLGKANKVDPYYLISNDLLDPLRVDVNAYVPPSNPFSCEGTAGPWEEEELRSAFAKANVIEVGSTESIPQPNFFSVGSPSPIVSGLGSPDLSAPMSEAWTLKVTKVGVLNRKEDTLEGGKKAFNRKWRPWSVLLTGSQLLFFRDPIWANSLLAQAQSLQEQILFPHTPLFRPDELLSVRDAVAVFDSSYTRHPNTLRFAMPDGRQFLLQAADEDDLNQWLSRINYASAFKSVGVRMRQLAMSGTQAQLTGKAAAASHLQDMQHFSDGIPVRQWGQDVSQQGSPVNLSAGAPRGRKLTLVEPRGDIDNDVPVAPEIEGADQLQATFEEVKADLAAGRLAMSDEEHSSPSAGARPMSPQAWRLSSRSHIIKSKLEELDSKLSATQSLLDADMRFVQNVATLTPFQRSTKDRLTVAVQNVARRVAQLRLDIVRLECHRNVLMADMSSEAQDWSRAKKLALRVATDTLQTQLNESRSSVNLVPQMTVSSPDQVSEPIPIPPTQRSASVRSSHSAGSFHSALDFGPEWPSEDFSASTFLGVAQADSTPGGSETPSYFGFLSGNAQEDSSPRQSEDVAGADDSRLSVEEAEEWNKTRAAHRVSLVRVPSSFARRHSRKMIQEHASQDSVQE